MNRTIFLLYACMIGLWTTASAQEPPRSANEKPPHWVAMTDSAGQVIGLREDQKQGWKERGENWNAKYEALGKHPESHPTYIKLQNAREFDLKGFLTGGQYDKWKQLNKRSPHLQGGDPPGTDMPSDR